MDILYLHDKFAGDPPPAAEAEKLESNLNARMRCARCNSYVYCRRLLVDFDAVFSVFEDGTTFQR